MAARRLWVGALVVTVAICLVAAFVIWPHEERKARIAANESAAILSCKAYAEAQDIYRRRDWSKDGPLDFSTRIGGNSSLVNDERGEAFVDKALADAECDPGATVNEWGGKAVPKAGYCFKILTGKGPHAPGGSRSFMSGSLMTLGYALSAVPYVYGETGRHTFIISNMGTVYHKDRGPNDTGHVTVYDPDSTWQECE